HDRKRFARTLFGFISVSMGNQSDLTAWEGRPRFASQSHRREPPMPPFAPLDPAVLPAGIRSRFVERINGLTVHIIEAGYETPGRPCLLLLHGFPEIAYSWRKIMAPLAAAGFHVVAPDLRGYGRTMGWSANYDDDLRPFHPLNPVRDALGLVAALGYRDVTAVVGHDFGASVAAWCA